MTPLLRLQPVKVLVERLLRAPRAAAPGLAIRVAEVARATILHLAGQLTLEYVNELRDCVAEAASRPAPALVIDLSACPFIDSAGMAGLVTAFDRARKAGKHFVLVGLCPQVACALELARLLKVLPIAATIEVALGG